MAHREAEEVFGKQSLHQLALWLLPGMGCAALCVFLPWDVLFLDVPWLARSYNVYLYVQDVPIYFQNSVHLDSVS